MRFCNLIVTQPRLSSRLSRSHTEIIYSVLGHLLYDLILFEILDLFGDLTCYALQIALPTHSGNSLEHPRLCGLTGASQILLRVFPWC